MELERCRDYGIKPLILRQEPLTDVGSTSGVSAMIATMAEERVEHYKDNAELKSLIQKYLRS